MINLNGISTDELRKELRHRELEESKRANIAFIREIIELLEETIKDGEIKDNITVSIIGMGKDKWTEIKVQRELNDVQ